MFCEKKTMIGWRNVWSMKWRVPGQEVGQRKFGDRLWKKTYRHVNWTGRMPWIIIDGGSRKGMTDDHDRCEWVNVSSGTGSPGLSRTKSRQPKSGCVCACVCQHFMTLLTLIQHSHCQYFHVLLPIKSHDRPNWLHFIPDIPFACLPESFLCLSGYIIISSNMFNKCCKQLLATYHLYLTVRG